jgi:hypothetical protein
VAQVCERATRDLDHSRRASALADRQISRTKAALARAEAAGDDAAVERIEARLAKLIDRSERIDALLDARVAAHARLCAAAPPTTSA